MVPVWLWAGFYPLAVSITSFIFLCQWSCRFHTSWMGWTLESFFRFLMYFPSYQRRTCFSCSLSCFANEYVTNENTDNTIIVGMNANAERKWCIIVDKPYSKKIVDSFIRCVFVCLGHLLKISLKNIYWKVAEHTFKILRCEHCKILKVYLTIFQHGWKS